MVKIMVAILSRNNSAIDSVVMPKDRGVHSRLNIRPFQSVQECLRFISSPSVSTDDVVEHPFSVIPISLGDDGSTVLSIF